MDLLLLFKAIIIITLSLSISNLTQCVGILLYCIYKIYTYYYKAKRTLYFLTDDQCCNADYLRYNLTCENKNCPHKVQWEIISRILKAERSIDIAMYQLTNKDIVKALERAHERRVNIRIIVDKSVFNKAGSLEQAMKLLSAGNILLFLSVIWNCVMQSKYHFFNSGIDVRVLDRGRKLMHHKYCVIDSKSRNGILINGSSNWTHNVGIQESTKYCNKILYRQTLIIFYILFQNFRDSHKTKMCN